MAAFPLNSIRRSVFTTPINNCTELPAAVAHSCNLSYSGGRDQEDHGSKTAQANISQDPITKILNQKMAGGVAQVVGCLHKEVGVPEFRPQYLQKEMY
jgi:hypothetical protein